jgi:hypothetical protein
MFLQIFEVLLQKIFPWIELQMYTNVS